MQFGRFIPRGEIVKYQQTDDENKKCWSEKEREHGGAQRKNINNNSH